MARPQKMQIGARTPPGFSHGGSFNALVDAYYAGKAAPPGRNLPPKPALGSNPRVVALLENSLSTTLEPGEILGISGPIFDLATYPNQVYSAPNIEGVTPDASTHASSFAVALDFIPQNKVGPALVMGLAWVKVNWTDEGHTHCKVTTGQTLLQSSASGIKPIWNEEVPAAEYLPAELWALVMVGGPGSSATENVSHLAVMTVAAGASGWGPTGITAGTIGEAVLLDTDFSVSTTDALEVASLNNLPIAVDTLVELISLDGIEPGSVFPAGEPDPEADPPERRVWAKFLRVADELAAYATFAQLKSLSVGELDESETLGPDSIEWLGMECEET